MAKKTKESADEIIDNLAKDLGAGEAPPAAPVSLGKKKAPGADAHIVTIGEMLMNEGGKGGDDVSELLERFSAPGAKRKGAVNLMVVAALIVAVGAGFFFLQKLSSAEAREKRRELKLAAEEAYMKDQLAKLKRFGNLRIESLPVGAVVIQDGDPNKCMRPNLATGVQEPCLTPLDVQNLDIAQPYEFTLTKPGFEKFSVKVAVHLWAKAPSSEDYSFFQTVDLVPNACEYWFIYDGKKKQEVQFKEVLTGQKDCAAYKDKAQKEGATVTECTCKALTAPGAP